MNVEPIPFDRRVAVAAFRVQSRSRPDLFHAVALLKGDRGQFWSCECESFCWRDQKCAHITAALESRSRVAS